jgi:phosphatidate cytidylyltransferase
MTRHLTRIKTGLILGMLTIVTVFYFPTELFELLCGFILSAAFWEWLCLISIRRFLHKISLLLVFWIVLGVMYRHPLLSMQMACVAWALALCAIFIPQAQLQFLRHRFPQIVIGLLVLAPAWVALVYMHGASRALLFYLVLLVTFADTAAYFVGSHWGRHKLLPRVSPKKSVEGLIGGLIVGNIAGFGVALFTPGFSIAQTGFWLILGTFLIMVSVVGDLFESLIKRLYDAKDSGSLLPGHGGVLDRMDSLSAALPVYAVLYHFLRF